MTGHLLGAASGVEAVYSVLAIRDQIAPPTINLHEQDFDSGCDLDYCASKGTPNRNPRRCLNFVQLRAAPTARWCSNVMKADRSKKRQTGKPKTA